MTDRRRLLGDIAARILAISSPGVVRVAVDGVDGAGKSTFADELGDVLCASGRPVIRASVDSFHHQRSIRYRQGRDSPQGFFDDSYDYAALVTLLLDPLSGRGDRCFRREAFDHRRDATIVAQEEQAPSDAILVFDGIFLHRAGLRRYWDYSMFLDVPFHVSIPRGAQRGEGSPDPAAPSNRRYVEGQAIYLRTCNPREAASIVVNNEDLDAPFVVRRPNVWGMSTPALLRSGRLALRRLVPADAAFVQSLYARPEVLRGLLRIQEPISSSEARAMCEASGAAPDEHRFVGALRVDDYPVGLGIVRLHEAVPGMASIGYSVLPGFWRQGIGTELAALLVEYGLGTLGALDLRATTLVENVASARLLETLGFAVSDAHAREVDSRGTERRVVRWSLRRGAEFAHDPG